MSRFLLLFLFLIPIVALSQSLPGLIKQRNKAVASVVSYSREGAVIDRVNGFFISSDGILIMPAFPFAKSDSLMVVQYGGCKVKIDKVLSFHGYYNLVMVKVRKERDSDYLTPARSTIREPEEVLVLVHESAGAESEVGRISNVNSFPGMTRLGQLNTNMGASSAGAPVLNNKGEWLGILFDYPVTGADFVLSSLIMDDYRWSTLSLSPRELHANPVLRSRMKDDFVVAMMSFGAKLYGEGAKRASFFLKNYPEDMYAISVRAMMRQGYSNDEGWRDDAQWIIKNHPQIGLGYYLFAKYLLAREKQKEALEILQVCRKFENNMGEVLYELAMLVLQQRNDVKDAFDLLSQCVFKDSLADKAYYERGKLLLTHSSNKQKAMIDLNQAIYLNPNLEGVFTMRGNYFFENQNYAIAIIDFNEAIRRNPLDSHAWLIRGMAHYNIGMKDKACHDWERASKLGNGSGYKYISRYCGSLVQTY